MASDLVPKSVPSKDTQVKKKKDLASLLGSGSASKAANLIIERQKKMKDLLDSI